MTHGREHLGIVVAGLVAGAACGFLMHRTGADPAALSGATPAFAGDVATAAPGRKQIEKQMKNSEPGKAPSSGLRAGVPAGSASRPQGTDTVDRLSRYVREPYYYASLGRRDPFASLVDGQFLAEGNAGLVDVGNIKLVGIAWDDINRFAMVEDGRGFGYVLREGDAIRNGKVLKIDRESVTFVQTTAGVSSTITIDLPIREAK